MSNPAGALVGTLERATKFLFNPIVLFGIFAGLDAYMDETPTLAEAAGAGLPALLAGIIFKTQIEGVSLRRSFFSF